MGFTVKDKVRGTQVSLNDWENTKAKAKAAGSAVAGAAGTAARHTGNAVKTTARVGTQAAKDVAVPVAGLAAQGAKHVGTAIKGMTGFHNKEIRRASAGKSHRAIDEH